MKTLQPGETHRCEVLLAVQSRGTDGRTRVRLNFQVFREASEIFSFVVGFAGSKQRPHQIPSAVFELRLD